MKALKWIGITILIAILFIFIKDMIHIFNSAKSAAKATQSLSNIKQLGMASALYREDFEGRYPHASAMPGHQAQMSPYTKNAALFPEPNARLSEVTFNFNLAGVPTRYSKSAKASDFFLGSDNQYGPAGVIEYYSYMQAQDYPTSIIVVFADNNVKKYWQKQKTEFFEIIGKQFDRKGATLAPADYLADHDPLRK